MGSCSTCVSPRIISLAHTPNTCHGVKSGPKGSYNGNGHELWVISQLWQVHEISPLNNFQETSTKGLNQHPRESALFSPRPSLFVRGFVWLASRGRYFNDVCAGKMRTIGREVALLQTSFKYGPKFENSHLEPQFLCRRFDAPPVVTYIN